MDKDILLKSRLPTAELVIPDVGTVTVRGMSRAEALAMKKADTPHGYEVPMLATCMVDPRLTEDEVIAWQQAVPVSEIGPVVDRINELSGLVPGAPKEAMATFRQRSGG